MFNPSILELESQINYHQQQQQELEQELDRLKVVSAFAEDATDKVSEALEHIDPKYLEVFKEHLLSLFPKETPMYLEEKVEEDLDEIEYLEEGDPEFRTIEQLQQEDPDTVVAVFHSEEYLKEQEEKPEKTYYELTGKPDLRPTTYEDLASNISYSSDGRAYVGFNNKDEAEEFRDAISEPFLLDNAVIMNGFKYEVKFHCSKEYIQEIADSVNSMSDEPTENFEEINPRVIYNHNDKTVYLGMTAKSRCDYYGQLLTGQLTVGEKYTYSDKPSFINAEQYKYELRITEIELDDAVLLASFNLQRDPEHPDNAKLLTDWRANKVRELNLGKPRPKLTPLAEIKLGDIVYLNSIDNQYKVLSKVELDGTPHIEVICVFNSERPSLVSAMSYLKECYLVPTDSIQIDPKFHKEEEEEVLTEDVQIYVPKEKSTAKKSGILTENDFPASPYNPIELTELEFGDIVTSTPHSKSAYEVIAVNKEYATAICLYHQALPLRRGEQYTFANPYLVEKALSEIKEAEVLTDEPIPA